MSEFIIRLHGDKSITHRAFILAALATGESIIRNVGRGEDLGSTRRVLRQMGVVIESISEDSWRVEGLGGINHFKPSKEVLDCGNSGTSIRLLAGLFSGLNQRVTLDGDASLRRRPMRRLAKVLSPLGRSLHSSSSGGAPLQVGGDLNHELDYGSNSEDTVYINTASGSAQLKSAALLAALSDTRKIEVQEIAQSRDHSERMLGALWSRSIIEPDLKLCLPAQKPQIPAFEMISPGDLSSASFWIAVAALSDMNKASIKLEGVNLNSSRMGLIRLAQKMGVDVHIQIEKEVLGEPVGFLCINAPSAQQNLKAIQPSAQEVIDALDELPLLALLASFAEGRSEIRHARELRVKESDRLEAMGTALSSLGAQIEILEDGWIIDGDPNLLFTPKNELDTHGDHRIAMCLLIAQLKCIKGAKLKLNDLDCIAVSYPEFPKQLSAYCAS